MGRRQFETSSARYHRSRIGRRKPASRLRPPALGCIESSSVESFVQTYSFVDLNSYGYASRPRPIGVDQELVLLVKGDPNTPRIFDRPTLISGAQFAVELRADRWLVAGFSRADPRRNCLNKVAPEMNSLTSIAADLLVDRDEAEEIFDRSPGSGDALAAGPKDALLLRAKSRQC